MTGGSLCAGACGETPVGAAPTVPAWGPAGLRKAAWRVTVSREIGIPLQKKCTQAARETSAFNGLPVRVYK